MPTSEPSYFNFLMQNRGSRRTAVPFAETVGVLPELARRARFRSAVRFAGLQPKASSRAFRVRSGTLDRWSAL